MCTLCTGSDGKGLTVAEKAEKELPESEIAKGGSSFIQLSLRPSSAREPLHRQKRRAGLFVIFSNPSNNKNNNNNNNNKTSNKQKSDKPNHATTLNQVQPCQPILIDKQKMVAVN